MLKIGWGQQQKISTGSLVANELKPLRIYSQCIYLWPMLCVNTSVGNWFDFASIRINQLVIGLITSSWTASVQKSLSEYRFHCQSLSKNSADRALLAD